MANKKVVVIGGGHGQSAILRGIKNIDNIDISAIVTVADDGGSTGRLRQQFHIPAMGDIRNVMLALAESESLLSTLMDYRFKSNENPDEEDVDVQGHNLGNLILTALTESCGSFMEAISTVSKVLRVKGVIIPATLQVISLYAVMEEGTIVKGEANIPTFDNRIQRVFYQDDVKATPQAIKAIAEADLIIYGIGSVYTSILPNIIIPQIREALKQANGKKVYFCNAMSQPGETDNYTMEDHVNALLEHGAPVDEVVVASDPIPDKIVQRYLDQKSTIVRIAQSSHPYKVRMASLLNFDRQLVRHDSGKIRAVTEQLVWELEK
ncbi:MAG: uridine diphosphate-N-acetylglucosamine-binding protein YvcK [Erysipelotrichaceae bacterium]|nr:uridine diphosphate-N-acetylglucosamine-binding protein YvcK [Erysipelotrichaceae bacterium]